MSQSGRASSGWLNSTPRVSANARLAGVDVDQLQPREREGAQELGHHAADQSGADHGDPVAQPGSGLPECR